MSYTFDKPFAKSASNLVFGPTGPTNPQDALGVAHRDEMKIMLGIDRPTFIFSKTRTMNISAQIIYTEREKISLGTDINGLPARKDETQLTLNLSQPFYGDQLFFEFFGLVDLDDGYWLQPQVRWQPGNNWRVWAYYNAIGGSEERSVAAFSHTDELNLAVSYQF